MHRRAGAEGPRAERRGRPGIGQSYRREDVAALIDHTLLKPEATEADVARLVDEAIELGAYAICVSPSMVAVAKRSGAHDKPVAAVVGFPSGKHLSTIKAEEARLAVAAGADEIDMVIDVGAAVSADFTAVAADVAAVRAAVGHNIVVKVIVESAALLSIVGERALVSACRAAAEAGADFVKTSTGFHPAGGASLRAVELMCAAVGPRVEVKASGGIRTTADAVAMLDAGATRLGLSGTRSVLDGLTAAERVTDAN
jgi:deoxyribose-phosphate aldolase